MAHPTRERFFPYLRKMLGDVPFSIDIDNSGVWPNCRRAWELGLEMKTDAPYHAVIQDDAVVCQRFYERAEGVLEQVGVHERIFRRKGMCDELAVNFYFGRRPKLLRIGAESMRKGYWMFYNVCWGVAICLRREWVREMVEFCDRLDMPQDDERITRYLRSKGRHTYFPVPSLVDHRPSSEVPSLVGDPGANRRAYAFIDKVRGR